jgi:hypothetical protein
MMLLLCRQYYYEANATGMEKIDEIWGPIYNNFYICVDGGLFCTFSEDLSAKRRRPPMRITFWSLDLQCTVEIWSQLKRTGTYLSTVGSWVNGPRDVHAKPWSQSLIYGWTAHIAQGWTVTLI